VILIYIIIERKIFFLVIRKLNTIYQGLCEDLIKKLPDDFIDLVITSPPYNIDLGKNRYNQNPYDLYQDNKDHKDYIAWLKDIFESLKPKMKSGGRICINIGDGKNGSVPTHSDIIQFMTKDKNLKYLLKSTIIWNKSQIGNRTSWGSFKSPSNPSFPTPFEYVMIFCKDVQIKKGDRQNITVSKEEFIENSLAIWKIAPENRMNKKFGHPAMFPLGLPIRLIQQLSYKNDIVLDIFSGMGTTCLAAAMLDRKWIGFELSERYVKASIERINNYVNQERLFK